MKKLEFKKLSISDKELIETITAQYLPYSDFNFLSLFTYDTKGSVAFVVHNANLIVRFQDYLDGTTFYSLIGHHKLQETIHDLIYYAKSSGHKYELNLVPQSVIDADPNLHQQFKIVEDRNNFDYIVSSLELANLHPDTHPKKHKLVSDFKATYPKLTVKPIDLSKKSSQRAIIRIFKRWRKSNNKTKKEAAAELTAIKRLLKYSHHFPHLYAIGIYKRRKLVAFNTYEVSTHGHGVSSFQKADRKYNGIYAFLTHEMAKNMVELGCHSINFEQDLGLDGLRSSKKSWHPTGYLKKYKIATHDDAPPANDLTSS